MRATRVIHGIATARPGAALEQQELRAQLRNVQKLYNTRSEQAHAVQINFIFREIAPQIADSALSEFVRAPCSRIAVSRDCRKPIARERLSTLAHDLRRRERRSPTAG